MQRPIFLQAAFDLQDAHGLKGAVLPLVFFVVLP
jgi:hypothetical protein